MHVLEELAARHILHQEVEPQIVLEHHLHLHDEGVVQLQHDQSLKVDVAH